VLLDHLSRGDVRHALQLLVRGLEAQLGGPCELVAEAAGWRFGAAAPGALETVLERLGRRLGHLRLPAGTPPCVVDEVSACAAALLLREADNPDSEPLAGALALISTALSEADTYIWEWDLDSDLLSDADLGFRLLGYDGDAIGRTQADWNRLIHPDDLAANDEAYLRHARGEVALYEHEYRARDAQGRWRWLQERGRIVERHADGRPRRMLGTQTDVTQRREMEAAAEAAEQRLERARQEAAASAAANRAKTEFLSRMSHELRTPLNAVLGFAQLMQIDTVEPPADGQRRRLQLIREAGEHLLKMIGDLLDVTRIESGALVMGFETVDAGTLASECVELVRHEAERGQLQLTLALHGAPPVRADRTRLRQVLLNLLANAIKYNRPGGRITLCVEAADAGTVRVSVADTGVGIEADDLPRVFEPFFRAGNAARGVDGSGIGLTVTRALVVAMDGRIDVQSTPGEGSVFGVTLPRAAG
jgi:PAS domain S-box-containing protein